jgi:HAD superfamily hydrolase (TIGR01490 family)
MARFFPAFRRARQGFALAPSGGRALDAAMRHLAIYDMDKTVTTRATWTRFLIHAARRRAPWRLALLPVAGLLGIGYGLGLIGRGRLKEVAQRLLLGRAVAPGELAEVAESFARAELAQGIGDGTRERIAHDRAQGYRLVLATASHGYYAGIIGRLLGFDAVIATGARRDEQGRVLSKLDGDNCYGPVKLHRIEDWLAGEGLDRSAVHVRAYSDHVSDAPLLAWADEAFAVNAHPPLSALAAKRGWTQLDWR